MRKRRRPIPNSLRSYRKDRGLSQRDVARLLGMSSSTIISRWERGRSLPSPINLFRLAAIYSTMVDALYRDLAQIIRKELKKDTSPSVRPPQS